MARLTRTLIMLAALALAVAPAEASFVASPMEHHLQVPAGGEGSARMAIRNTADSTITLKLYLSDSSFDTEGREQDADPGEVARSCAPWVQLQDVLMEIAPGETRHTELRLRVPGDAAGSYWTKLYIEEIGGPAPPRTSDGERRFRVLMRQRVGIRIFQDVPGTQVLDAAVTGVQVRPSEGNGREISVKVANRGTALLRCHGHLEIRDPHGDVSEVIPLGSNGEFWIFPGNHRSLSVASDVPLSPGTYTALAVVDFGGEHLVAGEQIFQVIAEGPITGTGGEGM